MGMYHSSGIARILSHPSHGNMAVALLARRPDSLTDVIKTVKTQNPSAVLEAFPTDTSPEKLRKAFVDIKSHQSFADLKLKIAIFSIKNSSKKPFMTETFEEFMKPMEDYVGGAMVFAQESCRRFFEDHGEGTLADGAGKKGTLVSFVFDDWLVNVLTVDVRRSSRELCKCGSFISS